MGWVCAVVVAVVGLVFGVASSAAADQIRDRQWHLDFLKADRVHALTKGDGATVAVVDTGVDAAHPDLKGNVLKGTDVSSTLGGDGWKDEDGHGTAMASLIAGHGHGSGGRDGVLGLAPEAKILPVRDHTGEEGMSFGDEAIRWAVDHGATVINFSAVETGLADAIEYALSNDVVVIAAVGNTGEGDSVVGEPANLPGVIAVSGIDKSGAFTKESVEGSDVALAAPAVGIMAAGAGDRGRYATATGTSDATALVSAAAALVRAKYPDLNAANVIERLVRTADDRGEKGRDSKYGFGVVNPLKALTAEVPEVAKNPLGGPSGESSGEAGKPGGGDEPSKLTARDTSDAAGLGVLVGAGLGVAALLAIAVGVALMLRNRRRRRPVPAPLPPPGMMPGAWRPPPPGAPGAGPGP